MENYADHGEYEHHIFIIKSILFDLDFFLISDLKQCVTFRDGKQKNEKI